MQTIISSFKGKSASFVVLEVSSLKNIQATHNEAEVALAEKIIAHAINKVVSNFQRLYKEEAFAQVFFLEDAEENLAQLDMISFVQKRNLAETAAAVAAANSYTLRAWFGIFFVALIFFVCYALFNVEIVKDSLLYAKFLTDERK